MEYAILNNGIKMPMAGIGTFLLSPDEAESAVLHALEDGYRLIDTAQMYENEREVGQGLRLAGLPREEVWVTTKIFRPDTTYAKAKAAIQRSLDQLALDYITLQCCVDLFRIQVGSVNLLVAARTGMAHGLHIVLSSKQIKIPHLWFAGHEELNRTGQQHLVIIST